MDETHIAALDENKAHKEDVGCVHKCCEYWSSTKHGSYRYRCYMETKDKSKTYTKAAGGRLSNKKASLYNLDFAGDLAGFVAAMKSVKKAPANSEDWWIGSEVKDGKRKPYWNQASYPFLQNTHHILPATSLHKGFDDDVKPLTWLLEAGYHLNDEHNTIILPKQQEWANTLNLPDHPHGHTDYNKNVKEIIKKIQRDIKKETKKHTLEKQDMAKMKDMLVDWEKRQFGVIVKYGEQCALEEYVNAINQCDMAKANK